jgi:hypothetical protein
MCPLAGRDTRPTSPRTRTRPNSPSITRFTAPEISETVNSGAFCPGRASSNSSMPLSACGNAAPTLEPARTKGKRRTRRGPAR